MEAQHSGEGCKPGCSGTWRFTRAKALYRRLYLGTATLRRQRAAKLFSTQGLSKVLCGMQGIQINLQVLALQELCTGPQTTISQNAEKTADSS